MSNRDLEAQRPHLRPLGATKSSPPKPPSSRHTDVHTLFQQSQVLGEAHRQSQLCHSLTNFNLLDGRIQSGSSAFPPRTSGSSLTPYITLPAAARGSRVHSLHYGLGSRVPEKHYVPPQSSSSCGKGRDQLKTVGEITWSRNARRGIPGQQSKTKQRFCRELSRLPNPP